MYSNINPDRLRTLRSRRGFSQKQLATEVKVNVTTISRWERGEGTSLRSGNLGLVCKALRTSPHELCTEGPLPDQAMERPGVPKGQANFLMDNACRNALALIARRYGVTRQQILEAAPLMFFILAEQSLADRRARLEHLRNTTDEAVRSAAGHLRPLLRGSLNAHDEELLESEAESVDARDLFATRTVGWSDSLDTVNPFARFLSKKLAEAGVSENCAVTWEPGEAPRYVIGVDEIKEFLGADKSACAHVLNGYVALAEMPMEIRRGAAELRAKWVMDKAGMQYRELREGLENLDFDSTGFELIQMTGNTFDRGSNDDEM